MSQVSTETAKAIAAAEAEIAQLQQLMPGVEEALRQAAEQLIAGRDCVAAQKHWGECCDCETGLQLRIAELHDYAERCRRGLPPRY